MNQIIPPINTSPCVYILSSILTTNLRIILVQYPPSPEAEAVRLREDIRRIYRALAASASKDYPLKDTAAILEAKIAAAGSDKPLLLELMNSQASQLLHASVMCHKPSSTNTEAGSASLPGQALRYPTRVQSAHVRSLSSGIVRSSLLGGNGVAGSTTIKQDSGALSSFMSNDASLASVLLESIALLEDLRRQASSTEAARHEAEARAGQAQGKLEMAQQDVTMLRNMVGELQASGSLVKSGSSIRPSTAGECL